MLGRCDAVATKHSKPSLRYKAFVTRLSLQSLRYKAFDTKLWDMELQQLNASAHTGSC
jgi:hypothetical protein